MMKVIKYIGVVCMLSVLAGCVDDKTIDEFKVLNQVTIEGYKSGILYCYIIVYNVRRSSGLLKMTRVICPTFGMLILRLPVMKQTH